MARTDFPWALLDNHYNNRFQKLSLQDVPVRQLTIRSAWNYRLFLERPEWFTYTTPGMFAMLGKRNPETGRYRRRAPTASSRRRTRTSSSSTSPSPARTSTTCRRSTPDDPDLEKHDPSVPLRLDAARGRRREGGRERPGAEQRPARPGDAGQLPLRHQGPPHRRLRLHRHRRRGRRTDHPRALLGAVRAPGHPPARRAQPGRLRLPGRVQGAPPPVPGLPVPHVPQPRRRHALALRPRPHHHGAGALAAEDGRPATSTPSSS